MKTRQLVKIASGAVLTLGVIAVTGRLSAPPRVQAQDNGDNEEEQLVRCLGQGSFQRRAPEHLRGLHRPQPCAVQRPRHGDAVAADLFDRVRDRRGGGWASAAAAMKAFNADGITVQQFNEPAGGQVVFHLHMHVMPRHDGVALLPPASRKEDGKVLEEHAAKVIAALRAQ